jgi:hypothetical protein
MTFKATFCDDSCNRAYNGYPDEEEEEYEEQDDLYSGIVGITPEHPTPARYEFSSEENRYLPR